MKIASREQFTREILLAECELVLRAGGIVVAPTDTVYGILGRADRADVIEKVFAQKQRPQEKALPVFIKDIAEARKLAYVSDAKAEFLKKIWPGPVTAVFHHKEKLPEILTGGKDTIGLRMPNSPFLLELLHRLDFPLLQTSANISEQPPAKNREEIERYFSAEKIQPDLVIDGGEIVGKHSTLIDFTGKEPIVLRTGMVSRSELDEILSSLSTQVDK